MSSDVSIMTSARQTLWLVLASLCTHLGSQAHHNQKTPYERELDRLLNASEDEPPVVRRYVGLLKGRAWWV
jgi:hypothetical protein